MKRSTWKEKMFNVEVDINIVTRVKPMIRWRRASVSNSEILLAQPDWLNYQFLTEWHMNSSNESNNDQKSHAAIVLVPKDVLVDFFFITTTHRWNHSRVSFSEFAFVMSLRRFWCPEALYWLYCKRFCISSRDSIVPRCPSSPMEKAAQPSIIRFNPTPSVVSLGVYERNKKRLCWPAHSCFDEWLCLGLLICGYVCALVF